MSSASRIKWEPIMIEVEASNCGFSDPTPIPGTVALIVNLVEFSSGKWKGKENAFILQLWKQDGGQNSPTHPPVKLMSRSTLGWRRRPTGSMGSPWDMEDTTLKTHWRQEKYETWTCMAVYEVVIWPGRRRRRLTSGPNRCLVRLLHLQFQCESRQKGEQRWKCLNWKHKKGWFIAWYSGNKNNPPTKIFIILSIWCCEA